MDIKPCSLTMREGHKRDSSRVQVLKKIYGSKNEVSENYMMKRFMVCGHNFLHISVR